MKIMLNGATAGTNFGDFLFAKMFQDKTAERVGLENVYWFNSRTTYSDFYRTRLKNNNVCRFSEIDALIYISGGYFGGNDKKFRDYLFRYLNYFHIGLTCLRRKKMYAVIGLEVARSKSKILDFVQKVLLRNANIVVVRNSKSYEVAKEYGVKKLICTADSVFAMERSFFANKKIDPKIEKCDKKILLLHVHPRTTLNEPIASKIVPIVNAFLKRRPEYVPLVATDQECRSDEVERIAARLESDLVLTATYDDPIALCKVIDCCSVIVTPKLHMGIVGIRLGKSVISFSGHTEKISRLYAQLGESGRSAPLSELTQERGEEMLEEYHDKPTRLPEEIIAAAKKNFEILDAFLDEVEGKSVGEKSV